MLNKRCLLALLSFLLVIGAGFNQAFSAQVGVNLVKNPGFEEVSDSSLMPHNWIRSTYNAKVTFASSTEVSRTGERSVRIDGELDPASRFGPRGNFHQFVPLEDDSNAIYRLSAWYRTQGVTKPDAVEIRLTFYDDSDKYIDIRGNDSFRIISPAAPLHKFEGGHLLHIYAESLAPDDWKEIQASFKAPEGATKVDVQLFLWYHPGTVWWDDVVLERME